MVLNVGILFSNEREFATCSNIGLTYKESENMTYNPVLYFKAQNLTKLIDSI